MSVDPNAAASPPNWSDVLALVAKLDASGLQDAEIVMDGLSVRVSKSVLPSNAGQPRHEPAEPIVQPSATRERISQPAPVPSPEPSAPAEGPEVTAPMLGVIYVRPSPDAEPFVQVGDTVTPETTVAIVEVMKMMNPVVAGIQGTVAEICVKDGQLVEYGDVLIRLEAG